MTEQETIEILKRDLKIQKENKCLPDGIEALLMAIKALEKQIPKKPDFEGDGYDNHGNLIYDTWICPSCEKKYEVEYEEYDYCPNCGQHIDWSEEE